MNYEKNGYRKIMSVFLIVTIIGIYLLVNTNKIAFHLEANAVVNNSNETIGKLVNNAIRELYKKSKSYVVILDQIPFEGGILVLADEQTDGEHYPELHFINKGGKVTYMTRGSYCWTLNYTQFMGHKIFFGIASTETRQYGANPTPVMRVNAVFSNKSISTTPRKSFIDMLNFSQRKPIPSKIAQGYILPVNGNEMPNDFTAILKDGKTLSLSKLAIKQDISYMPDYLKTNRKDIYNSFAYTFTSMLSLKEWQEAYMDGSVYLEINLDKNGNWTTFFPRAIGNTKPLSNGLPQKLAPIYQSDSSSYITHFYSGEKTLIKYPETQNRKLVDIRMIKLSKANVVKDMVLEDLSIIKVGKDNILTLPKEKGYYLLVLRTQKKVEVQNYCGVFHIR